MKQITLVKSDDGKTILVTSDENQTGTAIAFESTRNEDKQFMIALSYFLGYEPSSLLCFDDDENE